MPSSHRHTSSPAVLTMDFSCRSVMLAAPAKKFIAPKMTESFFQLDRSAPVGMYGADTGEVCQTLRIRLSIQSWTIADVWPTNRVSPGSTATIRVAHASKIAVFPNPTQATTAISFTAGSSSQSQMTEWAGTESSEYRAPSGELGR